jgi:hypothetical protein
MKKFPVITFILLSFAINAQTAQDLFSPRQMNVTWLGVDFSHTKIFGGATDKIKEYFVDYCYRANQTIAEDHHRFYFPIAYKKDFTYNTSFINGINKNMDSVIIVTSKRSIPHLTTIDIKQIVAKYNFPTDLKGIGLIYMYDSMCRKGNDSGKVWMVYLNIESKEILFMQNADVELNGVSFEEQLAYPVLGMLRKSKKEFNEWSEDPKKYNLLNK